MVQGLVKEPSARLLKHVIRCYLRLSDNPRCVCVCVCVYVYVCVCMCVRSARMCVCKGEQC